MVKKDLGDRALDSFVLLQKSHINKCCKVFKGHVIIKYSLI